MDKKKVFVCMAICMAIGGGLAIESQRNTLSYKAQPQKVMTLSGTPKVDKIVKPQGKLVKQQSIKGIDQVKEKAPFKVKLPNKNLDDLTLDNSFLETNTFDSGSVSMSKTYYKGNNKFLLIMQGIEKEPPEKVIEGCDKVTVNGTDAWIYDPTNGASNIQIMIWKDGNYYNVSGVGIGRERLIKIAESLS